MDRSNSHGLFAGLEIPSDTNISAPWPMFLPAAVRRYPAVSLMTTAMLLFPFILVGVYIVLAFPDFQTQAPLVLLPGLALASYALEKQLCRTVVVIRPEEGMVCIDEQRWWRDQERLIPDSVKRFDEDTRRPVAWLYPATTLIPDPTEEDPDRMRSTAIMLPFTAWEKPLEVTADMASAAHVGGVRTTMAAAEHIALHQEPDGKEIARYGLLAIIILSGLLAAYLAGSKAIDAFVTGTSSVSGG